MPMTCSICGSATGQPTPRVPAATPRRRPRLIAVLVMAAITTGCSTVVGGSVHPARGLTPRPLFGRAAAQVLLDSAELLHAYGQPFSPDPDFPDAVGGAELLMPNAQTPPDCAGVVNMLLDDSYQDAAVRDVVSRNWKNTERDPEALLVHEAVVTLPTARDAAARFVDLAARWKRCGGASMTIGGDYDFTSRVGAVEEKNSVLSAPVDDISSYMVLPEGRALGVRVNCLIELNVVYMDGKDRDRTGRRTPTAADVTHLIMDKVSRLT